MLAVVGRRRRVALALGQRLHRAAEGRPRLEQLDLPAGVDELERGGETGEPSTDDDRPHRRRPCPTMRSFESADSFGGPPKTSKPVASIRSSVSRYNSANVPTQSALRRSSCGSRRRPSAR